MQRSSFFKQTAALLSFCLLAITTQAGSGTGRDHLKVYLNNQLIHEQYVGESVKLSNLRLDKANANDQLTFHYSHCGKIGTGRKLTVKDDKGGTIREWKFADATGKQSGMVVAVKELLQLKQDNLRFFYTATELPQGQLMAAFHVTDKTTSWVPGSSVLQFLC
ncbi:hypothetical protein [Chitinophaga sp. YIM B06452]|uniref:hypothetical protein n=1 Tax=Chitinophaga sp. YIM B06452 TaxID=3082158 RepID=UPI0031FF1C06